MSHRLDAVLDVDTDDDACKVGGDLVIVDDTAQPIFRLLYKLFFLSSLAYCLSLVDVVVRWSRSCLKINSQLQGTKTGHQAE